MTQSIVLLLVVRVAAVVSITLLALVFVAASLIVCFGEFDRRPGPPRFDL